MRKLFTLLTAALLCCIWSTVSADELTLASDGSSFNSNVPVYGGMASYYVRSQHIYSKNDLSDMIGSQITQMTFYTTSSYANVSWGNATFKVGLAEVEAADFGETTDPKPDFNTATLTTVYSGELSVSNQIMTIAFDDPFEYKGGNLLLDVQTITSGTGNSAFFVAKATGTSGPIYGIAGYNLSSAANITTSATQQRNIPKTTFSYSAVSSCTKPTSLVFTNLTPRNVTISWTKGEEPESSILEYKLSTASEWTTVNGATSPYNLTNLTNNSTYNVRVKNSCGVEGESGYLTKSFTTPFEVPTSALPYEMDFESVSTSQIPDGWKKIANGNYPCVQAASNYVSAYNGSKVLVLSGGGATTSCMIILPLFETSYNALTLSFWYNNDYTYTTWAKGKIGYITDPDDASTFQELKTLTPVNNYTQEKDFSLAGIPAGAYVAIQLADGSNDVGKIWIDDLEVASTTPTCPKPTGLNITNIEANSATVTWSDGGATSSLLKYKLSSAENWTEVPDAESPYNLTGLTANSTYEVQVKNICSGLGETNFVSKEFTTLCAIINVDAAHPYSQDFNSTSKGTIPECWDNSEEENSSYATVWKVSAGGHGNAGSSERCAEFNSSSNDNGYINYLKTPSIYLSNVGTLTFWYKNPQGGDLSVYYSIDDGAKILLESGLVNQSTWTEYSEEIPAACVGHNVVFMFKGTSNENWAMEDGNIDIDDILIECAPSTCLEPTDIVISNITTSSASITWTKGNEETEWQYICLPADAALNWTSAAVKTVQTTPAASVTGLNANTGYIFYVRANCGSEYSATASKEFRTECTEITALTCGFEESEGCEADAYPECWKKIGATHVITTTDAHTGSQAISVNGSTEQYIILPKFAQSVNKLQISFWYKRTGNNAYLQVGTMSDPTDKNTFTPVTSSLETPTSWTNVGIITLDEAPNANHYIALRHHGAYQSAVVFFDDFVVEAIPTCLPPVDLILASTPTATTAQLTWKAKTKETAWIIQTSTNGTVWSQNINVNAKPYTLTGLTANTSYYVRVKADCAGDEESDWSEVYNFHTACEAITALPWTETFESMTDNSVPDCWDNATSTSLLSVDTEADAVWCVYDDGSNKTIRLNTNNVDAGTALINTPTIVLPATPVQALTFDYVHNATCDDLYVKVSDNGGSSFTTIGQFNEGTDAAPIAAISLKNYAGKSIILQFYTEINKSKYDIIIDNVQIAQASGEATFINNINVKTTVIKRMENGVLYIIHNGVKYNVLGEKIQ